LARLEQQRAMERERMRIAQDMHDEIGSKLTKISFLSERAKVELKETGPVAGQIDSIAHTSRELLQALDEIVWAVNPRNDTLEHLAAYLAQYAAEYFQNTTVDCDLRLQAELPPQVMSAEIRHNLFLAFEECLNNVLKHAGASKVRVEIKADPGQMQITISDNGRGFELNVKTRENSTDSGSNRNGLRNIHQRLAEVGGQCHIQSRPGEGTTVRLHIPLSSAKFQPA
jgi:signal transduction histidine kinase